MSASTLDVPAFDVSLLRTPRAGDTFLNGANGIHAHGANWHARLMIVKTVAGAYGCTRYIVSDAHGKRYYATGPEL